MQRKTLTAWIDNCRFVIHWTPLSVSAGFCISKWKDKDIKTKAARFYIPNAPAYPLNFLWTFVGPPFLFFFLHRRLLLIPMEWQSPSAAVDIFSMQRQRPPAALFTDDWWLASFSDFPFSYFTQKQSHRTASAIFPSRSPAGGPSGQLYGLILCILDSQILWLVQQNKYIFDVSCMASFFMLVSQILLILMKHIPHKPEKN